MASGNPQASGNAAPFEEPLYIGTAKHVVAIDAASGVEIWRTKLPSGDSLVTLLITGDSIFVGSQGTVHCLDRFTGQVRWTNKLPKLGYSPVVLGMHGVGVSGPEPAVHRARAAAAAAAAG